MRKLFVRMPLLLLLSVTFHQVVKADNEGDIPGKSKISGVVVDENSKQPLEFASVAILDAGDSSIIDGAVTGLDGKFSFQLDHGSYIFRVDYLSYESTFLSDNRIEQGAKAVDLGTITLSPADKVLEEIEITAEKSQVEVALDKRVFNVEGDLASIGGNATDILDNIPSVAVDAEGNVNLRGSTNVRVLIDGKQSGLAGISSTEALQQLPANMIEKVEVITNPSSRYDAEGMAGIINIVLKKNRASGFNGSFDLAGGYPLRLNGSANLNYRHKKINFFVNYGISGSRSPGFGNFYREFYGNNEVSILYQDQDRIRGGLSNTFRTGLDFFLNKNNTITGAFLYRYGNDFSEVNLISSEYNENNQFISGNIRQTLEKETEPYLDFNLTFKHQFPKEGKELVLDVDYNSSEEVEDSDIDEYDVDEAGNPTGTQVNQRSLNAESQENFIAQADYIHPFLQKGKAELGMKSSLRHIGNDFYVEEQDGEGSWNNLPGFTNQFIYDEQIHAAYTNVGNEMGRFSYQGGIRMEMTRISTLLEQTGENNDKNYTDFFPSVFLNYRLENQNSIQASFSRRINRPGFWLLNPFFGYDNDQAIRSGNPDLNPEYINAMEVGYMKDWNSSSVSTSVYYRTMTNVIQWISTINEEGVLFFRPENLSNGNSYGLEFIGSVNPYKWWKVNGSANFFRFITDGSNLGESYYSDTYSWTGRINSRFTINKLFDFQLMYNYRAPEVTTQGKRLSMQFLDMALTKDLFNKKGTLSFRISDVFNTRYMRFEASGTDFYTRNEFQWRPRQIILGFTYRLNQNQRKAGDRNRQEGGFDQMEMF